MGRVIEIDEALWQRFTAIAGRRGRRPEAALVSLINDFIEEESDRKLDAAIAMDLRRGGYQEEDAVSLVADYRRQVKGGAVKKVGEGGTGYQRKRRA